MDIVRTVAAGAVGAEKEDIVEPKPVYIAVEVY